MPESTRRLAAELTAGEKLDQVFLISMPQLRTTSRGDYYIAAYLSDRSGRVNGRFWQASQELYNSLPQEGFVRVRGHTELYQGTINLVVDSVQPVDGSQVNLTDFLPATDKDVDEMFRRVNGVLTQIKNPHLARLVQAFLADEPLMALFRTAPAAIQLHHAWLGGLLEHTLSLLELGQRVLGHYPQLDADLVLVGLFLHDIGKTTELDYDLAFKYSDQGRLIGHVVQTALLIQRKIDQLNCSTQTPFPPLLADSLLHIVLSHHGQREFGCPVLPATPEAFAVHYLDNLDSKIALTLSHIDKDNSDSHWTSYLPALESPIFKPRKSEEL